MSPSSRTHDRVLRRKLYAEAGIPFYLLVDVQQDVVEIIGFELVRGKYREYARSDAGKLTLSVPFPVELDLSGG